MAIRKAKIWVYDVWGNAEDGYEINDRMCIKTLEIDDDLSAEEIWNFLYEHEIVSKKFSDDYHYSDFMQEDACYYERVEDNFPLLEVEFEVNRS